MSEATLCWTCSKFNFRCSWSQDFTPVAGWKAEENKNGYLVQECPEYDRDSYNNGLWRERDLVENFKKKKVKR